MAAAMKGSESFAGHGALMSKGVINDLVLLDEISEDAVTETLRKRHAADLMYAYVGPVLVSVNPFKPLGIYGDEVVRRYHGAYQHENTPHLFAVAEEAFRSMRVDRDNQCVIITGESGSGKTEASKQILHFVSAVSEGTEEIRRVKDQMLRSNPVLEAFGNAKTVRNNNSSRFGKWMTIVFDFKAMPVGGRVQSYLLEKSRVVGASHGERSFHIFYQMIRGLPEEERRELALPEDPTHFSYLRRAGEGQIDGVDDAAEWRETRAGLEALGVDGETLRELTRVVSAVLWLGQVEFKQSAEGCAVDGPAGVRRVAELLGCEERALADALVARKIEVTLGGSSSSSSLNGGAGGGGGAGHGRQRSTSVVPLDVEKAQHTRDALAKTIYSRLFDWLVRRINKAIDPSHHMSERDLASAVTIGVLDIYGFEIFERNSFEQLCINYVNEKLQQIFIDHTLRTEQDEYRSEGIAWEEIEFFNNKVVCELIEARPVGLISLLDEACLFPRSTDETMLSKLDDHFLGKHKHYRRPRQQSAAFTIQHYAGDVVYSAEGFLEKNRDPVRRDLLVLGESCQLGLMSELFPADEIEERGSRRPVTAATGFKTQVLSLMETLGACTPHYVRCIKPNDNKAAGEFDLERSAHQVRYLGLVENVRVRRAGFTFRQDVGLFLRRYKMLSTRTWPRWDGEDADGVRALLGEYGVDDSRDGFQIGRTKVFIREPQTLYRLEEERQRRLHDVATLISKTWKMFVQRKQYRRVIAARNIQSFVRGRKLREWYGRERAATAVQSFVRGRETRQWYARERAALAVQRYWRGYSDRERYARERAARTVQQFARGSLDREYCRRFGASRKIQKNYRGYLSRKAYLQLRGEAVRLYGGRKLRRTESVRRVHECRHLDAPAEEGVRGLVPAEEVVAFSADVTKVNRKGGLDPRVLVLTDKAVWLLDKVKWAVKLHAPLHELAGLAFSTLADGYVVVRTAKPDGTRFDVLLETQYKTELLVAANTLYRHARSGADLEVTCSDEIEFCIKKKVVRTVRFRKDAGTTEAPVVGSAVSADKAHKNSILVLVNERHTASDDLLRKVGALQSS